MNFSRFRSKPAGTALASSRIPDIPFSALPREISRKLRGAAARIRRILFLRGLFAVLATALIAILASMAVDYMVAFTGHTVRWILWALGVGAVAFVARQTLVKPLAQKFTPARLAALLERNHPELQERLSTVVELLSMPEAVGEGSELLLDVVKSAAEADVRGLSPSREFSIRTVKPRFFLTAAAVLVLAVLFLVWPDDVGRLFARAVVPAAEIDNVWADNLRVSPGRDEFVLEGEPYSIHLAVVGGFPGKAYVRCRPLDGSSRETSERMAESAATKEDGTGVRHYSHTVAAVEKPFSYYVVCGSAVTRAYDVVSLPVPAFSDPSVTLHFPAYTGAAPKTLAEGELDVSAVAGTRVSLRLVPNGTAARPVHAQLALADERVLAAEETDGSPVSWEFPVSSGTAGSWEIRLFDDNGFTNAPVVHSLSVLQDETPSISFLSPTNLLFTLPAHGTVPVSYELKDDFGVSAPMLQAKVDSGPWRDLKPLPAEPSGTVAPVRSGAAEIRLSDLPDAPKAGVQFRLRARDNLPPSLGGPHEAFSPVIAVRLDGAARTLGSKRLQQAGERAKAKADNIEKDLQDAMEKTREARREQLANRPEQAAEKLAEAKEAIAKAEEKAREMVRETKNGDLAALAKDAKDLLEETLKPAREKADEAIAAKPEKRVEEIDKLLEKLDGAADAAKDLQEKRKALEKELKAAQELAELSDKQKMLANELRKKMTDEEKKAWDEKQQALLDELKKKQAEMSADPLAAQRELAEDLAKRYAALARKQQALENTAAALARDPAAGEARAALAKATPDLPAGSIDAERFAAAQDPLAHEAETLAREVGALVRSLPSRALLDAANPVSAARKQANSARERARAAAEEARLRVQDEKSPPGAADAAGPSGEAPSPSDEDDEDAGGLDDLLTADDLAALAAAAPPRTDMDEEMKAAATAEERAAQLLAVSAKAIDELSKKMGEENLEAAKRAQEAMEAAKEALKNQADPLAKQREKAQELAARFEELANRQDALEKAQESGATGKLADDQRELASDVSKLRNELDDLVRTIPNKTAAATDVRAARSDSEEARREASGAAEEAKLRADEKDGAKKAEPAPAPTATDDFFGEEDEFGGGLDDLLTADDLETIAHVEEPVRRDLAKTMDRAEDALRRGKEKMDRAAKAIDELSQQLAKGMDPSAQQDRQNQSSSDSSQMQQQQMDPSQMQQTAGDPNAQRDWQGERDPDAETQDAAGDPNADRQWDGERDPNAEVPIGEWDPDGEHAPWDGIKDPNAQDEQKDGQWDPNAERAPWDGQKDPNAKDEPKDGQWDPNAKREPWDGKKDPNAKDEPPKDGQWDPNRKKEPWDGKRDPNAQQQQQQGQQQNKDQQKGERQQGQQDQQPQNAQQQAQQQAQNAADQMQQMSQQMQQQAGSQQQQNQQQGQQQNQQNQQQNQQGQQQQNQQDQQNQQNQQNSQQSGQHHDANKPLDPNSIGEYNPLRNLGVSDNDWLRVQNGGGTEALDAAVENVPPEYRDLVREYFQALANEK